MEMTEKQSLATELESLIHTYDFGKAADAAYSLVSQYIKKGQHDNSLTVSQWGFVKSLVGQATNVSIVTAGVDVGDFAGVIDLFLVAKEHIKYPKVSLVNSEGDIVQLSMAGSRARYPGTINVTDGGKYGDNTWYGRVDTSGKFQKTQAATPAIVSLLKQLADNPHLAASFNGKATNNCCFCSKDLTHANSVAAGYGPICAGHWGLTDEWKAAVEKANHVH